MNYSEPTEEDLKAIKGYVWFFRCESINYFKDNAHYQELKKRASLAGDVQLPPLAGETPSKLDKINEEDNLSETARFDINKPLKFQISFVQSQNFAWKHQRFFTTDNKRFSNSGTKNFCQTWFLDKQTIFINKK